MKTTEGEKSIRGQKKEHKPTYYVVSAGCLFLSSLNM